MPSEPEIKNVREAGAGLWAGAKLSSAQCEEGKWSREWEGVSQLLDCRLSLLLTAAHLVWGIQLGGWAYGNGGF